VNKEFAEAMGKTLFAFECLISDTAEHRPEWHDFGNMYSCHICKPYIARLEKDDCTGCPLLTVASDHDEEQPPCVTEAYDTLDWAFQHGSDDDVRDACFIRYCEFLDFLDQLGFCYE